MRKHIALSILGALLIFPAVAAAGGPPLTLAGALSFLDGGSGTPAAWSGIWTQQITVYDCTTETLILSMAVTDTVCTGDPVYNSGPDIGITCSGTVTDTHVDMDCGWTSEEPPGCMMTNTLHMVATRSSDSSQMTVTMNANYVGDSCDFVGDICMRTEMTGIRIGPQPSSCESPVEAVTWGRVKALYR